MGAAPVSRLTFGVSALVVLLAAGAGGFMSYRLLAPRPTITAAPVASHPPAVIESEAPARRPVPEFVPAISIADLEGKPHSLTQWKGKLLVLNFWATWCEPCQREIPLLKRVRAQRAAQGVEVVGIAVDLRAAVAKYTHQARIDYPVLVGEEDGLAAITALGMNTVFPFTVFADREGRIVTLKIGELREREAQLILDRMVDLDQGKLTLGEARAQIANGMAALAGVH